MKLVTFATHDEGYYKWYVQSCKRHNVDLNVIGWGEKWRGFGHKMEGLLEFVNKQDPEELVCCTDAYDVILLQSEKEIIDKYTSISKREKVPIVIGSGRFTYPKINIIHNRLFFGSCRGKDLNAGTIMGPAQKISNILEKTRHIWENNAKADDQIILTKYCSKHKTDLYIDKDCELFGVVASIFSPIIKTPSVKVESGNLFINGNQPAFLHAPANSDIIGILQELGYIVKNEDAAKLIEYRKKYFKRAASHQFRVFLPKLILLIGALCMVYFAYRYLYLSKYANNRRRAITR